MTCQVGHLALTQSFSTIISKACMQYNFAHTKLSISSLEMPANTGWPVSIHKVVVSVYTHTHTTVLLLFWNMSGTTRVSRYHKGETRKVKTDLDLLEQEIVSGSGISWAICKLQRLLPLTSSKVSPCGRHMGSPPIVHTHRVPPCMAQSRLGAFPR